MPNNPKVFRPFILELARFRYITPGFPQRFLTSIDHGACNARSGHALGMVHGEEMSDRVPSGDFVVSVADAAESKPSTSFCLIVDDEKAIRSIIARSLRKQMVMTEECGEASSAVA